MENSHEKTFRPHSPGRAGFVCHRLGTERPFDRDVEAQPVQIEIRPGPPPRSQTQKYESAGKDTLKRTQDGIDANGQPSPGEGTIIFDGKEHPVANSQTADASVNRRFDAYTSQLTQTKGGMLVNVVQRFVSPDGKTLTLKQITLDAQGKLSRYIQVFDKQ